ncbi:MAG: hypothetical protein V3V89_04980, partial [Gammaproteobacteria bacterium]
MITNFFKKIFGSRNERVLKRMRKTVVKINALEEQYSTLSDSAFPEKTEEFRKRLTQGESLEDLL